jgi:hypothetical protein
MLDTDHIFFSSRNPLSPYIMQITTENNEGRFKVSRLFIVIHAFTGIATVRCTPLYAEFLISILL